MSPTRTSRRCRSHASSEVGGAGLLGLLLVVVIIGLLATMSVSSTWFARTPMQPELEAVVTGPEGGAVRSLVPSEIASAELARRFACRANFKSVEAAVARKQAVEGVPPTDIGELVADGLLDPTINGGTDRFGVEVHDSDVSIVVNGTPGIDGCIRV